jgi:hypothetical protein
MIIIDRNRSDAAMETVVWRALSVPVGTTNVTAGGPMASWLEHANCLRPRLATVFTSATLKHRAPHDTRYPVSQISVLRILGPDLAVPRAKRVRVRHL